MQELADLATSPAADVSGFDSQPRRVIPISRNEESVVQDDPEDDYEEDESADFDRPAAPKLWPSNNQAPMEDLMQPMDSERKLSVPKPGVFMRAPRSSR